MAQSDNAFYKAQELIQFYASLVGTTDVSEDVKKDCNRIIGKLVETTKPFIDRFTAEMSGIIV